MPADWPRSLKKTKMTQQARLARLRNVQYIATGKGQLIWKGLFGVFNSSKKRTKTIRLCSGKVEYFVRFWGEFKIPKRHFEIN